MGISIVSHNRDLRPTDLTEGQTCMYSKDSAGSNSNRITIKPDDSITIETKIGQEIILDNTSVRINGNLEVLI